MSNRCIFSASNATFNENVNLYCEKSLTTKRYSLVETFPQHFQAYWPADKDNDLKTTNFQVNFKKIIGSLLNH